MKIQCEVCEKAEAEVLCCSDEAVLCKPCDIKVHEANKLFQRHHRVSLQKDAASATTASGAPLCDICQERKGYFFCLEDRALLCNDCDGAIHTCNSHQRFLLSGVQVSDQSLTENSGCSTSFSSEAYQIHSKASLNSQYSSEETEAGNSGAGPRIGCVRDYPSELQFQALEQVNLSPRSAFVSHRHCKCKRLKCHRYGEECHYLQISHSQIHN